MSLSALPGARRVALFGARAAGQAAFCALFALFVPACDEGPAPKGTPPRPDWPPRPAVAVAATQPAAVPGGQAQRAESLRVPEPRANNPRALLLTTEETQSNGRISNQFVTSQGLLFRELFRQAVLIAGRDGLGLATRDQCLQEPLTSPAAGDANGGAEAAEGAAAAAAADVPLDLHWYMLANGYGWFALSDHDPARVPGPPDWVGTELAQPMTVKPWHEQAVTVRQTVNSQIVPLDGIVEQVEALSRNELVAALKSAGFGGEANKSDPDGTLPPAVEERLTQIDLFAQYEAVRAAHAAIREHGESPARLAALARGYANLGRLTDFFWRGTHNGFTARSLLYAQRMVATAPEPRRRFALWHRAYARALAGAHGAALEDLAAAGKNENAAGKDADAKGAGLPAAEAPPSFVELLDPLCRYRTARLADLALADPKRAPLAMFLCFQTVQHSYSPSLVIPLGEATLEANPGMAHIYDVMHDRAGVGYLHGLTDDAPESFAALMLARLKPMTTLPEPVRAVGRKQWQAPATRAAVARALVDAGRPGADAGEPSWATLGRMVQDVHFTQAEHSVDFLRSKLGVDPRGEAIGLQPLLADHPYGPYVTVTLAGLPGAAPGGDPQKAVAEVPLLDLEIKGAGTLTDAVRNARRATGSKFSGGFMGHFNPTAPHLERMSVGDRPQPGHGFARALLEVSPHAPAGIAYLIRHAWDEHVDQVKGWEENSGQHPTVMAAFAMRHTAAGEPAEAERFLKAYLSRAPDHWAYDMLADNYLKQGKEDQWLATLEEFLTKEDYHLSHSQVRSKIARHFMDQGDYARAEPYALASASSGAQWAMQTAADCYEGMGEWDKAAGWRQDIAQRYGGGATSFYQWCVRTGYGDPAAAKLREGKPEEAARLASPRAAGLRAQAERAARAEARAGAASPDREARVTAAGFHLLAGEQAPAQEILAEVVKTGDPWSGLHLALMHAEAGDAAARDAVLDGLAKAAPTYRYLGGRREMFAVAKLLAADFKADPAARNVAELDAALQQATDAGGGGGIDPGERTTIDYFIGRYFELRKDKALAKKYYTRCVGGETAKTNAAFACVALRRMGVDPPTVLPKKQKGPVG